MVILCFFRRALIGEYWLCNKKPVKLVFPDYFMMHQKQISVVVYKMGKIFFPTLKYLTWTAQQPAWHHIPSSNHLWVKPEFFMTFVEEAITWILRSKSWDFPTFDYTCYTKIYIFLTFIMQFEVYFLFLTIFWNYRV